MTLTHEDSLKNLIKDLCLIPGLSGYEDNVRHYLEDKLKLIDIKILYRCTWKFNLHFAWREKSSISDVICAHGSTRFCCKKN